MCSTPLSFSACNTISAPVISICLPAISPDPLSRLFAGLHSPIEAIKKGSFRSLVSRMGAFAGWLRHPAHTRSYHENVRDLCHGDFRIASNGLRQRLYSNIRALQTRNGKAGNTPLTQRCDGDCDGQPENHGNRNDFTTSRYARRARPPRHVRGRKPQVGSGDRLLRCQGHRQRLRGKRRCRPGGTLVGGAADFDQRRREPGCRTCLFDGNRFSRMVGNRRQRDAYRSRIGRRDPYRHQRKNRIQRRHLAISLSRGGGASHALLRSGGDL